MFCFFVFFLLSTLYSSSPTAISKCHRSVGWTTVVYFLTALEAASLRTRFWPIWLLMKVLFMVCTWPPSLCVLHDLSFVYTLEEGGNFKHRFSQWLLFTCCYCLNHCFNYGWKRDIRFMFCFLNSCSLWHWDLLLLLFYLWPHCMAWWGILFPNQGWNHAPCSGNSES